MSVQALTGKFMELFAHARAYCAWGCTTDIERRHHMKRVAFLLVAVAVVAGVVAATAPQSGRAEEGPAPQAAPPRSAKEVRGASPYVAIEKEPAPKLIVDPPLPEGLAQRGRLLGPVPSGERAHRTRVRGGCPPGISTCRTSAHNRRRPALVVGGCE